MKSNSELSIYLHIPFCRIRCDYCDFNTYAGLGHIIETYVNALITEVEVVGCNMQDNQKVHTVYFGGGTPSILRITHFERILRKLNKLYKFSNDVEVTIEANPYKLSPRYLERLYMVGINRLSFGMQSAINSELATLGRRHSLNDLVNSVSDSKKAGFTNINLDLIYGIPLQTVTSFKTSLETAHSLKPQHLSLYALTLEKHTRLYRLIEEDIVPEIDEDMAAEMYIMAMDYLEEKGYRQYEISNWAIDENYRSRHNLQYWRNGAYLGFGAGAHSHYNQRRWENIQTIPQYIRQLNKKKEKLANEPPAALKSKILTKQETIQETMMMGLRLTDEGIKLADYKKRFGRELLDMYDQEVSKLIRQGLLECYCQDGKQGIRLTRKGRILGNQVFMEFMGD